MKMLLWGIQIPGKVFGIPDYTPQSTLKKKLHFCSAAFSWVEHSGTISFHAFGEKWQSWIPAIRRWSISSLTLTASGCSDQPKKTHSFMVPRCTQALDKCKCVSWAHRHQWDCLAAAQIRQNWHFYCLPMPFFICQRRSLTPRRDVGPFSSPVNVATAYRTRWVLLPTHHNHVCPLAVLSSCTLEGWTELIPWSCQVKHMWNFNPNPTGSTCLPKPFNPFIGIQWKRRAKS